MSAFLGPIHTWLFGKIKFQNELINKIVSYAIDNDWIESNIVVEKFGTLEDGELKNIIDESNIHGWLQDRVSLVESSLAYLVTELIKNNADRFELICRLAYDFGVENQFKIYADVESAYKYIDSLLLDGMPCDRVNEIVTNEENLIVWKQNKDIHAQH